MTDAQPYRVPGAWHSPRGYEVVATPGAGKAHLRNPSAQRTWCGRVLPGAEALLAEQVADRLSSQFCTRCTSANGWAEIQTAARGAMAQTPPVSRFEQEYGAPAEPPKVRT